MSSSPEETATAQLWRSRARGVPALPYASALLGMDVGTLSDAVSLRLAASDEAVDLLDGMELRIRTLTCTVVASSERCINAVRGPIQWSETITARANALGNDDVFVCSTSTRTFDTVENRVLAAALDSIARAGRALEGPLGDRLSPRDLVRIRRSADDAGRWRAHPRLADVRSGRLDGRDTARLRGGHRLSRLRPVIAIRDREREPFIAEDLDGLADVSTLLYHSFVTSVLRRLVDRSMVHGPTQLADGALTLGAATFRHPGLDSPAPGLCFRGIPLIPAAELYSEASWSDRVPVDGVVVTSADDLDRFLDRISGATPVPAPQGARRARSPLTSGGSGPGRTADQASTSSALS